MTAGEDSPQSGIRNRRPTKICSTVCSPSITPPSVNRCSRHTLVDGVGLAQTTRQPLLRPPGSCAALLSSARNSESVARDERADGTSKTWLRQYLPC